MSAGRTRLVFASEHTAELWFAQVRSQWLVSETQIESHPEGGVWATVVCPTSGGALIPAEKKAQEEESDGTR